jgi:hypothetical protein
LRHCCQFKADDIYYLTETNLYVTRKLNIGFCPICKKPVSELILIRFDGAIERERYSGYKAQEIASKCIFDPICIERDGACTGCLFLNEVSCEHFNKDLNRALIIGHYDKAKSKKYYGFWEES